MILQISERQTTLQHWHAPSLQSMLCNISQVDVISMKEMDQENVDAQAVISINQALMGAEKEVHLLDVNFSMSDEPVENGMFIFGIWEIP